MLPSIRKVASPFTWEALTFRASGMALRMESQMCASHMPHIMPSICTVIFCVCFIVSWHLLMLDITNQW